MRQETIDKLQEAFEANGVEITNGKGTGATEQVMKREAGPQKSEFSAAMSVLGGVFAASTIIHLIQQGWSIQLNWGFSHFVEFYRSAMLPFVDLVQMPFRWALGALNVHIVVPLWLKDLHTLSFVLAGVYVRGWRSDVEAMADHILPPDLREEFLPALSNPFERLATALFLGFTGLSYVFWTVAMGQALVSRSEAYWMREREKRTLNSRSAKALMRDELVRLRFRRLVNTASVAVLAVAAFYISNAVVPQLNR